MERKGLALEKAQFKLESDGAGFVGYASTFGNVDSYGDTIVKGAYADTLKTHGLPKMFFNHNANAVPIGKWVDAKEDDYGLLLKGEFTPGNALAQEVKAALQHGTLDSMSIGYMLRKGDYETTTAGRLIKRVSRLAETSIVTFPADSFARVDLASVKMADEADVANAIDWLAKAIKLHKGHMDGSEPPTPKSQEAMMKMMERAMSYLGGSTMKSMDFEALLPECKTERDIERLLRDAGLGKWEAMAIVSRAKAIFDGRDAPEDAQAKTDALILERLQKLSA